MWEIEVWHLSVVACFKRVWSPLSAAEAFGSALKHLQWVKLWGKVDFSPLLFSLHCLLLCDGGREELFKGTSHWILDGYTPLPLFFLITSANTEMIQQATTKTNFIIISMSCLCSSPGPHLPLWRLLLAVIWHCSYLNYKWNGNLLWWC